MSRHSNFYKDLKQGAYDCDDEDDYYDDEEDYEDDYDYSVAAKKPAAAATKKTTSQPKQAPPPPSSSSSTLDANGIPLSEPDYDFLAQSFAKVRQAVGPMVTTATIIDNLRKHGYDSQQAIQTIKQNKVPHAKKAVVITSSHAEHTEHATEKVEMKRAESEAMLAVESTSKASAAPASSSAPTQQGACIDYTNAAEAKDGSGKEGLTIVITGHVDSGKSTILGHLLLQRGYYSNNDVKKNEAIGSANGKASFKYAWLLDQSEEERRRGVTIDSGAHGFETDTKRVTVLDAPGHIDFITNMISSATQADAALLVVTVRKGEFESGLEKGTREHLVVLHTLGVRSIIVAMNKMDTVDFSQERFEEVKALLMVEILAAKYAPENIKAFIPVSGLLGINLVAGKHESIPWYTGPSLFEAFDAVTVGDRFINSPLRLSVQDTNKNTVYGRVETGRVKKGDKVLFIPSNTSFSVKSIALQAGSVVNEALAGTSVELTLSEEAIGISSGDVACAPKYPVPYSNEFEAVIDVFPTAKKAVLPGSRFILCIHATVVSATVATLKARISKEGTRVGGMVKAVAPNSQAVVRIRADRPIALERGEGLRALGVFVMRQDDETIGGGIVQEVLPVSY